MKIEKFAYKDLETGWELAETRFDAINLLVGVSGVGKTRIIEALRAVVLVGASEYNAAPLARWAWTFEDKGVTYQWEAETAEGSNGHRGRHVFVHEVVRQGDEELVRRSRTSFDFAGSALPKLGPTASALHLLGGEDRVEPILRSMDRVIFSLFTGDHQTPSTPYQFFSGDGGELLPQLVASERASAVDGSRFTADFGQDPHRERAHQNDFVLQLYLMQASRPEQFREICERFYEVFPSVSSLRVVLDASADRLSIEIQEGAERWVPQSRISSGMLKTLVYLCEFDTAPSGSVIVIDEFEASLGLNCLPAMTDALLARQDCQFIVTSHHPYVINKIPIERWKLVERTGSTVKLASARDIPALKGTSHHEAFLRLINVDRYAHGIR